MSAADTTPPPSPGGCLGWPMCGLEVRGECRCYPREARPTLRMAPPDPVAAYLAKRAAIAALWAECDALWDGASESQRDAMVTALGSDWRPRRG